MQSSRSKLGKTPVTTKFLSWRHSGLPLGSLNGPATVVDGSGIVSGMSGIIDTISSEDLSEPVVLSAF